MGQGAWDVLSSFGIEANAFAGHSFGELVALYAAGRPSAEQLATLAHQRGAFMAGDGSDKGTMLAISADMDTVTALMAGIDDITVANHNAPQQVVVAGSRQAVCRRTMLQRPRHTLHPITRCCCLP